MSGRKRIYVDEAQWNRLRREAGRLAEMKRDLPRLIQQVRDQTEQDIDRSMHQVQARQTEFEQAVERLSERSRQFEQETAHRLRENTDQLRRDMHAQARHLETTTANALRAQRDELRHAIDSERRDRQRRLAEIDSRIDALRGDQDKAARLAADYLADAEILREQVLKLPHERYQPGRLDQLDSRLALVRSNVVDGVGAFGLAGAQELAQSFGEFRLELEQLDREWQACRLAAEHDLVRIQELIAQNTTLDLKGTFGADQPGDAPDVDHWSRGALTRLGIEVAALLAQVRDDDQPLTTEKLQEIVDSTAPEFELRLESVVGQAVTAIQASQLRTNLAELIADALDQRHHYEVDGAGFVGADDRDAFVAKTVHYASGSEIVIEVQPGDTQDAPPMVRLHNFDADGAAESERSARMTSIRQNVLEHSGIELTAQEEAARPDDTMRDITRRITRQATEQVTGTTTSGPTGTASSP